MSSGHRSVALLALAPLLFAAGCSQKKTLKVVGPTHAPTITSPLETQIAFELPSPPEPEIEEPAAAEAAPRPRPRRQRTLARATPPPVVEPPPEPEPTPPASGQISAGLSEQEAAQHRESTDQLLQRAEQNLTKLKRQLNNDEQSIVQQIRNYIQQARAATAAADLLRARNLAEKAQVLSDELLKR